MSEPQRSSLAIEKLDETTYILQALNRLTKAWTTKRPNQSKIRATFRRWRPDKSGNPSFSMQQYIWGWIGSPFKNEIGHPEYDSEEERRARRIRERTEERLINEAAIIIAMRAAAGDHESRYSLGTALQKAGMTDMRLMRLLMEQRSRRLLSLHRAVQFLDSKRIGVEWTIREIRNVLDFLFGSDSAAQRAANNWAADFFRSRGKTEKDDETEADKNEKNAEADA